METRKKIPLELDKEKESKPEEIMPEKVNLRSQQDDDKLPTTPPIPELESEESVAQKRNQQGQGLKILAPNQLLSTWAISLAQLNTGNNLEKLNNKIKQLLYSLYRSKKLTKMIYKSLIDII